MLPWAGRTMSVVLDVTGGEEDEAPERQTFAPRPTPRYSLVRGRRKDRDGRGYSNTRTYNPLENVCLFTSDLGGGSECSISVLDGKRPREFMSQASLCLASATSGPQETTAGTGRGSVRGPLPGRERAPKAHSHSACLSSLPTCSVVHAIETIYSSDFLRIYRCWAVEGPGSAQEPADGAGNPRAQPGTGRCAR